MARKRRSWPEGIERRIIVHKLCMDGDEPSPMRLILDGLEVLHNSRQLQYYEVRTDKDIQSDRSAARLLKECEAIERLRSELAEELGIIE